MLHDFRFALRMMLKSPGFSIVAVTTLALGIGANTAIFSVVESALLRPLPFPKPDRLVRIYETFDENGARTNNTLNLSEATLRQWSEHAGDVFEGIGVATGASLTNGGSIGEPAQNIAAARISSNFFTVLGLQPALGRNFTADEDRPGASRVVIVGYGYWKRTLGGQASALGQSIQLDGVPYTVIGVMPESFRHPYRAELWVPLGLTFAADTSHNHYLYGVGRLRAGVGIETADAVMRRICASINAAAPDPNNPPRAYIIPLRDSFVMDVRPKLLVIAAAALCALLVAAANFAGLMLARVVERDGEMALRSALGASRGRLVRQGLAQALVLSAFGTVLGLLLAGWLTPLLVALSPEGADATGSAIREFDHAVRLDWPVFAFAAGAMLLIGAGFGLLPAWRGSRTDLRSALGSTARGSTFDGGTRRLLGGLIVGEIAAAAVLLMASLALTQHFRNIVNEPWGFATAHRLIFNVAYSERLFASPGARARAVERTLAEIRALPGARSASVTAPSPMEAARELMGCVPEKSEPPATRGYFLAYFRGTEPGYFGTMKQTLLRGRDFAATDTPDGPPVCIVNESFARRFWPGEDPIGKRVKQGRLDGARPWLSVVGIVADTKAIVDPRDGEVIGSVCVPLATAIATRSDDMTFVIETEQQPEALERSIRSALVRVDNRLAAFNMISLETAAGDSWVTARFLFILVSLFGVLGLLLAGIGVYGLLALQVTRRTREFGIRMALGATGSALIRIVAAHGARLLALGFAFGAVAAWAAVRVARHYWPEVPTGDPLMWVGAAAVLASGVAFACWLPARRAARVDPMIALRAE